MFKIYLSQKLHGSEPSEKEDRTVRNRRLAERFNVSNQHITALNEEDILRIKDISVTGFACEVSERAFERFTISDRFDAKIHYLGETYLVDLRVAWKASFQVGFELIKPNEETTQLFKRLILPMEIASSLKIVDAEFMKEKDSKKTWYHGDSNSDLILWRDENKKLEAWQLITSNQYIEWNIEDGLQTGKAEIKDGVDALLNDSSVFMVPDETPDSKRIQLAIDIMMALRNQDSNDVLPTITEYSWDYESENISTDES